MGRAEYPTRRGLLALLAAGAIAPAVSALAEAPLQLVYVSARNCSYCAMFEAKGFEEMQDLAASRGVPLRVVRVARFQSYADDPFPEDLEWLKREGVRSGTPRFLLVRDGRIVVSAFGASNYEASIRPVLQETRNPT